MQKENIKFVILTVIILLVITIFLVIVIFNMQETRPNIVPVENTLEHQIELHEKEKKWLEHIRQVEEAENGHNRDNQSTR